MLDIFKEVEFFHAEALIKNYMIILEFDVKKLNIIKRINSKLI